MVVDNAPWMELDQYVGAYEAARATDEAADLRNFAPGPDDPLFLPVMRELVRVDLELGWAGGTPRPLDEYLRRVPELRRDPESLRAIAYEEYRLRRQAGQTASPDDYRRLGVELSDASSKGHASATAQPGEDLASAAHEYHRLRRRDGTGDGTVDWAADHTPLPHLALFRALHRSDPDAAERLARAATGWPKPGVTFEGFQLTEELGRGAFGRVFLARQGDLADRPVALKIACDFQGEPQRLAQLQHTNIVPVYSIHHQAPFHALCMPYFGSTTLGHVLAELGRQTQPPKSGRIFADIIGRRAKVQPRPSDDAPAASSLLATLSKQDYVAAVLTLAVRLADGLGHAHERGIVHRDLKPCNILLADDGQPMLLDFNLSADVKDPAAAEAAQVGGTLPYMPPELLAALGKHAPKRPAAPDARVDLYGLGVILWELLAFRHPFAIHKGHVNDVLPRMIADRQTPPDVRATNPAVPYAVAAIVAKCLAADPARRYQTARGLEEDLRRQLDDLPLRHAPEPSLRERGRKLWRRHPRTILAAAAAVPLFGLSIVAASMGRQAAVAGARVTYERFRDRANASRVVLATANLPADERARALDEARHALSWYGVDATGGPATPPAFAYLTGEERADARRDIGEMLLTCAKTSLDGSRGPAGPDDPRLREARRWNELAERFLTDGAGRRSLLLQRARLAERAGDEKLARDLLSEAEKTAAESSCDRFFDAWLATQNGRYRAALTIIGEALPRDPQSARLWALRGQCYEELGEHDRAAACWDTSIALVPDAYRSYYHRGVVRLKLKDVAAARADFDTTLRLDPGCAPALVQRAVARAELRDFAGAVSDLERARDLPHAPAQVYFVLARVRAQAGDKAGAERDRGEGLRRTPTDHIDWVIRGIARVAADPQAALADFDEALRINPQYAPALRNKAHVFAEVLNRPADAVAALDALLERYPDSVPDRASRGVVLARLGRDDAARADGRAVLASDPSPLVTYQVASLFALTSQRQSPDAEEALRLLAAALQKGVGLAFVARDRDLDPIRGRPEFRALVDAARTLHGVDAPKRGA